MKSEDDIRSVIGSYRPVNDLQEYECYVLNATASSYLIEKKRLTVRLTVNELAAVNGYQGWGAWLGVPSPSYWPRFSRDILRLVKHQCS